MDAVAAPRRDDAAAPRPGVRLDDAAELADRRPGLDELDGLVQALARRLDDPDGVGVCPGAVADVVRLVEVGVVAPVVDGDVQVEDVAVQEDAVVWDPVADDLVRGSTQGFGEVVIVQRRRVRLPRLDFKAPKSRLGTNPLTSRSTHALWQTSSR